jgi:hypothetical protein
VSGVTDFYAHTAEYVAVLIEPAWTGLGPALAAALAGLDTTAGPVVDVGAGSGPGTRAIATALPDAEIIAVEPDRALRTALLARLTTDPDLGGRVTVLGTDLLTADLPSQIGGLAAMNVIGHFSPADRARLWTVLAQRLAPQGRAVLNLYPPYRPASVPASPMGEVVLGRRRYSGTARAEPAGDDALTWEMTYRVEQDGERVTELDARYHWHVFTPEQLAGELAPHGLHVRPGDPAQGVHVVTRS